MSREPLYHLPSPPADLNRIGIEYWEKTGNQLIENNLLNVDNLDLFQNLTYWEQKRAEIQSKMMEDNRSAKNDKSGTVHETKMAILLSNLKAVQKEINKIRPIFSLIPIDHKSELAHSPEVPDEVYRHLPETLRSVLNCMDNPRRKDSFLFQLLPVISLHMPAVLFEHSEGLCSVSLVTMIVTDTPQPGSLMARIREVTAELTKQKVKEGMDAEIYHGFGLDQPSHNIGNGLFKSDGEGFFIDDVPDRLNSAEKFNTDLYLDLLASSYTNRSVSVTIQQKKAFIDTPRTSGVILSDFEKLKQHNDQFGTNSLSDLLIYAYKGTDDWESHRPSKANRQLNRYIPLLSAELFKIYNILSSRKTNLYLEMSDEQWDMIDETFAEKSLLINELGMPSVLNRVNRKAAIATIKVASIFLILRQFEQNSDHLKSADYLEVSDADLIAALWTADTLVKHAFRVYQILPDDQEGDTKGERYHKFFAVLPREFKTNEAVGLAQKMDIPERTAKRYLSSLTKEKKLNRIKKGSYQKS